MKKRLLAAAGVLAIVAGVPSPARAQICTLEPAAAFRGQVVQVTFAPEPTVAPGSAAPTEATVTFRGTSNTAPTAKVTLNGPRGTFTVPGNLSLGDYQAEFSIGCRVPMPVRSPVRLTLASISPAGTRWAAEKDAHGNDVEAKDNDGNKTAKQQNVTLALHGTGFITDKVSDNWTDNELWINDELMRGVRWNPPGAPKCDDTNATGTQADVLNSQTIRVCGLDLTPFTAGSDQGHLEAWGIRAATVRVAVGQPGIHRTDPQAFRIYPRWAGGGSVTMLSIVLTFLLAGVVLYCVAQYKRVRAGTGTPFSARTVLFLDPETDTYSLSKLQFYLWTLAAVFGYVYLVLSRLFVQGAEWPQVPDNLPGIVGIGIGTAVGAQVATNIRGPKGSGTELPNLGDFVMSGGVVAVDRVQMLVWTLLGVGIFVVAVAQHGPTDIEKLDSIPSTLLVLSGISTAGYLGGKLARKPGPVLDEIHIEPPASDEALAQTAVPPPGTVNLASALNIAQNVVLPASAAVSIKAGLDALVEAKALASGIRTVAQAGEALPALAAKRQIAETIAMAAADALVKVDTAENALAAETAQRAAAAIADLETAVRGAAGTFANRPADAPTFTRVITLRGRNLSPAAIFSIDGIALPFRMLKPDPLDPAAKRVPEVLITESGNPEMAMLLRLTIDPGQLGAADRAVYDRWFSRGSVTAHVFKVTNSDGQQDDLSFSVPPSAAQAPAKGGAAPSGPDTATIGATPGSGTVASGTSITRADEPGGGTQAGARP